jgi:hypothetical protein
MRKLLLAVGLCVVAVAVAPVASASAAANKKCTFEGTTTFEGGTLVAKPQKLKFKFVDEEVGLHKAGGKCENFPGGGGAEAVKTGEANTKVEGEGELSCEVSTSGLEVRGEATGKGVVTIGAKATFKIKVFAVVGVGPFVEFTAKGEQEVAPKEKFTTTVGTANFIENAGSLTLCSGAGIAKLKFEAEALAEVG